MEHTNNDPPQHKRRVRYRGAHPRHFKEKYKELNSQKYPEDVEKVILAGKTPAGTHRPICVNEILDILPFLSYILALLAAIIYFNRLPT